MLPANVPANTEPFLVGEFLVLPERNELRQLDATTGRPRPEAIRLTAKQMDVLVALASRPGQPVSKNEIFEAVWPGVVVGEDNITSCIYELRKAFGEGEYIKTVRQRGYLLTPSVTRPLPQRLLDELDPERPASAEILLSEANGDPAPAAASPPAAELAGANDRWGRRQLKIWLGALALVLVAAGFWLDRRGNFTVALTGFNNATGQPSYDGLAKSLDAGFDAYFKRIQPTYYVIRNLALFSSYSVQCTVSLKPNDRLQLKAEFIGIDAEDVVVTGPSDSGLGLGEQLFEGIARVLDTKVCLLDSQVDLLKAGHCLRAGERILKSRDTQAAKPLLHHAVEFYTQELPQHPVEAAVGLLEAWHNLANAYDIDGDRDKAREVINKALTIIEDRRYAVDRDGPAALKVLRRQAQIENWIQVEREIIERLLKKLPEDADIRHSRGWFVHTHDRSCDAAKIDFTEAIDGPGTGRDPAIRATYYSYIGDVYLDCEKPQEAIRSFTKHVELTPDEADPYEMRAQAYLMVGDYEDARTDINAALGLQSKSATLLKGQLERELGRFGEAEREFQSFLERPNLPPNSQRDGLLASGRLHLDAGNFATAREEALAALKLEGGYRMQAFWLLGLAELGLGKRDEARRALTLLEAEYAKTPSRYLKEYLYDLKAHVALAEKRPDDAQADLKLALDNYPTDRLYFLARKAAAFEESGRFEEAYAGYLALLAINPQQPRALCAAAKLAEKLGLLDQAAAHYRDAQQVLVEQPDDPRCQQCRARAEQLAGMPETIHE